MAAREDLVDEDAVIASGRGYGSVWVWIMDYVGINPGAAGFADRGEYRAGRPQIDPNVAGFVGMQARDRRHGPDFVVVIIPLGGLRNRWEQDLGIYGIDRIC